MSLLNSRTVSGGIDPRVFAKILLGSVAFLVYLLVVISGIGRFATTDDASMILIASGRFGDSYSLDQVFTSPPLGWLLAQLYSISSAIPWWALIQAACFALAVVLLVLVLRRDSPRFWLGFSFVTFTAGATVLMLTQMNFTQPAIFCTAVGLGVAIWARSKALTALGLGLSVLGMAWRQEGAYIALAVVALAWLSSLFLNWREQRPVRWSRGVGSLIFGTLAVIVIAWLPRQLQMRADSALREYREFIPAFSQLDGMGNYLYSETAAIEAANAGLSRTDWSLVSHWLLSDSQVFSVSALQSIASGRAIVPEVRSLPRLTVEFVDSLLRYPVWLLALTGIVLLALYVMGSRRQLQRLALVLGSGVVVMYGIFLYGRLPERVGLPTILATLAVAFLVMASDESSERVDTTGRADSTVRRTRLVLAAVLSCVPVAYLIGSQLVIPRPSVSAFADVVICTPPTKPVAMTTSYLGPELLKMPTNFDPRQDIPDRPLIFLDWWQRSPGFEDYRQSLGLEQEVLASVATGQALLITKSPEVPGLLAQFSEDHYQSIASGLEAVPCRDSGAILVQSEPQGND